MRYYNLNKFKIKNLYLNFHYAVLLSLAIVILLSLSYRILFGIEITDEALYVAEGYIFTQGATPYVDMWLQASGFAFLNAPFVWLYVAINGSTEGLILYFRIISILLRVSLIIIAIFVMKPLLKPKITFLWLLPFLAFVPYSIMAMSYNTWVLLLLPLSCVSILHSVFLEENRFLFAAIGGSIFALIILSYSVMIITAFFCIPLIFIYEKINNMGNKTLYGYLVGGMITGIVILIYFTLRSGSALAVYHGLETILIDTSYHELTAKIPEKSLHLSLQLFVKNIKNWLSLIFISYIFIYLPFLNKKRKLMIVTVSAILGILYFSYNLYVDYAPIMFTPRAQLQISTILCRLFFPIPIIILPLIDKKKKLAQAMIVFVYLPVLVSFFVSSFFAYNAINKQYYFLVQGTLLVIPFIFFAIKDLIKNKIARTIAFVSSSLLATVFAFGFLMNYYGYMYREDPMNKLDYKIDYGVYSGLKTTKARGEGIITLEKTIRSVTTSEENVLFMDCVPMAYLMTDALHTAPSTWDLLTYSYGFTDDILLQKYFKTVDRTPDKIIYIFTGRDKILSIDSENYKFNEYVNNNYKLTNDVEAYYPVRIYKKTKF